MFSSGVSYLTAQCSPVVLSGWWVFDSALWFYFIFMILSVALWVWFCLLFWVYLYLYHSLSLSTSRVSYMRVCLVCVYFPKSSLCLFPFGLFFVFLFVSLCISLPHPLCLSHLPCHVPLLVFHPLSPQVCLPCMLPCLLILISASSSCVLVAFQNFWILQRFGLPPVRIK